MKKTLEKLEFGFNLGNWKVGTMTRKTTDMCGKLLIKQEVGPEIQKRVFGNSKSFL